jgi:HD-like signal output (HDOD) protein
MDDRKRILFVEDDPLLLDLLRETLADMDGEWDMAFVESGEEALAAFARKPFDVIVSDLWMPGMNGAQLLQKILVRHPATVRFILSGCDDRAMAADVVDRAHQFLRKPIDPALLKSILRRTFLLGAHVHDDHARELVTRIGRLPSVPALFQEITRLMNSERATVENLGAAISKDMAMTAMLLKLANSAFFSLRHTVATPAEAISILGIDLLRSLVLAHGLFSQTGSFRFPTFSLDHLWRHSVAVASATSQIAVMRGEGRSSSAEYFTAGLLHDVGILVLASRFPDEYLRVLETSRKAGSDLETSEFHVLGATHGEVGGYLLGLWGLPPSVVHAASWHHLPHLETAGGLSPALAVHIADSLLAEDPEHEVFSTARLDEGHLKRLGLLDQLPAWRAQLDPDPAGLKDLFR